MTARTQDIYIYKYLETSMRKTRFHTVFFVVCFLLVYLHERQIDWIINRYFWSARVISVPICIQIAQWPQKKKNKFIYLHICHTHRHTRTLSTAWPTDKVNSPMLRRLMAFGFDFIFPLTLRIEIDYDGYTIHIFVEAIITDAETKKNTVRFIILSGECHECGVYMCSKMRESFGCVRFKTDFGYHTLFKVDKYYCDQ